MDDGFTMPRDLLKHETSDDDRFPVPYSIITFYLPQQRALYPRENGSNNHSKFTFVSFHVICIAIWRALGIASRQ